MDKRLRQLNNLRSFESAARHQSYSRAADELFVTQAAVSQQIRQLETALGCKLFMRQGRQMQLTQSGVKLYQASHQAFDILLKGFNSIQSEQVAGELTVTSTQSFSSLWLMPRLYRFSIAHPEIRIRILASNCLEDLRQGHIDLAIRFVTHADAAPDDGLIYDFVGEDDVYPVCSPQLASEMNLREPKDLLNCWLICLANPGRLGWENWFKHAGVAYSKCDDKCVEVSSGDMALSAVLSGHGVSLTSQALFSQYIDIGKLVIPFAIKHPVSFRRYLVFDPTSAKMARLAIFVDWLKQEMQTQPTSSLVD